MGGIRDIADGSTEQNQDNGTDEEQKKSLFGHTYSNDGTSDPDPYKDLSDWTCDESDIRLAYALAAPSSGENATVRNFLDNYEGGREQWLTEFVVALGHYFGSITTVPELESRDIEPQGAVPLMELFGFDPEDIVDWLVQEPETANEVYDLLEEASRDRQQEAEGPEQAAAEDSN